MVALIVFIVRSSSRYSSKVTDAIDAIKHSVPCNAVVQIPQQDLNAESLQSCYVEPVLGKTRYLISACSKPFRGDDCR